MIVPGEWVKPKLMKHLKGPGILQRPFVCMRRGCKEMFERHWLTRDKNGLSPTSDINGCFDKGPDPFFPGRHLFSKGAC